MLYSNETVFRGHPDKVCDEPPKSLYEECKPRNIIQDLGLLNTKFEKMARFGHFTS